MNCLYYTAICYVLINTGMQALYVYATNSAAALAGLIAVSVVLYCLWDGLKARKEIKNAPTVKGE